MNESAVQFATKSRIHLGLGVRDLERSVAFYSTLLGEPPSKRRPGYAKFEIAEPPVNLSLNEIEGETAPINSVAHFGIQVKSSKAVREAADRLLADGLSIEFENQVSCCYAVQDKIWATDPDGNRWEVYVVLDNDGTRHGSSRTDCCSESAPAAQLTELSSTDRAEHSRQQTTDSCGCPTSPEPTNR